MIVNADYAPGTTAQELEQVQQWRFWLQEVERRMGRHFSRPEARQRASAYVRGLLSPVERKNGWQLAEVSGAVNPYGAQHLLGRATWDAEQVRDDLRTYVVEHLGDPEAVLVVDETGFLKKGQHSAGVARQYSGTAGRVENCQIGVFLAYATEHGHALIDRELYLPKSWTQDRQRYEGAGIESGREFYTKPQLARQMLSRAFAAGVPASWVTGDSVYGDDRRLRVWLEAHERAYVLAVSGKDYVWMGVRQRQIKTILAALPEEGWARLSAGVGAKGPRWYDWLGLPLVAPLQPGWCRWLLVRRQISAPGALTAYVVFAPGQTPLERLVEVAGSRWRIEQCFEEAKGEVGLADYEVRAYKGWYRHMTLAMWAYGLLVALRVRHLPSEALWEKKGEHIQSSTLHAFKTSRGLICL